ncbi:MAG TPA: hypothetical protein VIK22_02890 [Candidatus Anoxymicrobiaceae bacterium]
MAKCKNCGTEVKHEVDTCPSCGQLGGTAQTITDLPGADLKGERKKLFAEIHEEGHKEKDMEGVSGGAQTISDLPKVNLREAHKKLKEEIREAREHDKEK